jgi:hypothetical protein
MPARRPQGHVVSAFADENTTDDAPANQVDHDQLAAAVVGDVRQILSAIYYDDMRVIEATERLPHTTLLVDERHRSGRRADRGSHAPRRRDVLGVGRQRYSPDDLPCRELDGH